MVNQKLKLCKLGDGHLNMMGTDKFNEITLKHLII